MIDFIERYLARAWFGAIDFAPTTQNLSRLATMLGRDDMAPLLFQEVGPAGFVNRPGAMTPDGVWRILIRTDSVDIEHRPRRNEPSPEFATFLAEAGATLSNVSVGLDRHASRIAGVQEVFLQDVGSERMAEVAARLLHLTPTFQEGLFEWDWRVCSLRSRAFGSHVEPGNTIVAIKRVAGLINDAQPFDRIRISTDINTKPNDTRPRFTSSDVQTFCRESAGWHDAMVGEVLRFMGLQQ